MSINIDDLKDDEYVDLKDLPYEQKKEFIEQVAFGCAKDLLRTFLSTGCKEFIELMVINNKTEYVLTFQIKEQFLKRLKVPE